MTQETDEPGVAPRKRGAALAVALLGRTATARLYGADERSDPRPLNPGYRVVIAGPYDQLPRTRQSTQVVELIQPAARDARAPERS